MIHGAPNNALAEISLALAMGFFSIMVLALVTMGGDMAAQSQLNQQDVAIQDSGADIKRSTPQKNKTKMQQSASTQNVPRKALVIYHNGTFLDANLKPIAPNSLKDRKRVVLAVDPNLPIADTLAARSKIPVKNLTLAPLDTRWQAALKEAKP